MKRTFIVTAICAAAMFTASPLVAETIKVPMNTVTPEGIGNEVGTVTFVDVPDGLDILVDLTGLSTGEHGMHIHTNPTCAPAEQDGKMVPALAAGGHWDPAGAKAHMGPGKAGHRGDLPFVTANAQGVAQEKLSVKGLSTKEIQNHSLMIHAGGDNYSDNPPLGGGGARFACGVIQ